MTDDFEEALRWARERAEESGESFVVVVDGHGGVRAKVQAAVPVPQ